MTECGTRAHVEMVMGLPFSIHVRGPYRPDAELAAVQRVWRDLRDADRVYSTFRPDSDISRIARGELSVDDADPSIKRVLALAERARTRTAGNFDVYYAGSLDPAGIVKTWAAARASRHLEELDADWYLGAGGDILLRSSSACAPWRVGIEDPADPGTLLAVVDIANGAIATSGRAHRGHHIVSPPTRRPPRTIAQATVCGPDLTWADIYATAWVAADTAAPDWAMMPGYECLLVTDAGATLCSPGVPALLAVSESEDHSRDTARPARMPIGGHGQEVPAR
jgi:thiamine biosynthesis lipoprotein